MDEVTRTLEELTSTFGLEVVRDTFQELYPTSSTHASVEQALRSYTIMMLDSRHPRAVAQIVARLSNIDVATGLPLRQEDIARSIGVSKQDICNMEADIATRLNLPRKSSEHARASHRLMNRRNPVLK